MKTKPKIVEFKDGKFGIRKTCFSLPPYHYLFYSLKDSIWLSINSTFFPDCKTDNLVFCEKILESLLRANDNLKKDYGKPFERDRKGTL